jgi:gliding motility-associated-like protein
VVKLLPQLKFAVRVNKSSMGKPNIILTFLLASLLPTIAFSQPIQKERKPLNHDKMPVEVMAAPFVTPIIIDDSYSGQQLVQDVLINGSCAVTSNFSISGDNSYGYFSDSDTRFPFSEGIVLSTSAVSRAAGPNTSSDGPNDSGSWLGDADLEEALAIPNTHNATTLEFDFTPVNDHIRFEYIFASKEYKGAYQCEFSDGFAFLLKPVGSAEPYVNLALIPDIFSPVSVTTIHPDVPGSCGPINEAYFNGYNPGNYPVNFDGQTIVMTAQADVVPNMVYHIKLVIADQTDAQFQSAIFLNAKSFNIGLDLGPDRVSGTSVCDGETILLQTQVSGNNTYQWYKDGNLLTAETSPQYTVSAPGTYSVEVTAFGSTCSSTDEIVVAYAGPVLLNNPISIVQCDSNGDGIAFFNLRKGDPLLIANGTVTYYMNLADAQAGLNPITNPLAFENTAVSQLTARVVNISGCTDYATVNLLVTNNVGALPAPVIVCDSNTQDGIGSIDLTQNVTPQILNGLPAGLTVAYYASENAAYSETDPLPDPFINTIPYQQTIYARTINGPDCYGITTVTLVVDAFDPEIFAEETVYLCNGGMKTLNAPSGFSSYVWNIGNTSSNINVAVAGNYSVTVTNANGCSMIKSYNVSASEIGVLEGVDIKDFSQDQNSIHIYFSGSGSYEFSIDGIRYQDSPVFTGIASGEYAVYIRDKNGCGISPPHPIYLIDYPKFFTPNGDGINDTWKIKLSEREPEMIISIFDRYGKLIGNFNGNNGLGWNGILDGKPLPSSDYWFVIRKSDGKEYRGHFCLKR